MSRLIAWIKVEPLRTLAILQAVVGVALVDVNPAVTGALITIAGVLLGVRQTVTPNGTVAAKVTQAATDTAAQLVDGVAGAAGQVTLPAAAVVDQVVAGVLR